MYATIKLSVLLVLLSVTTVTSQNCSTYNPCGQYGYCVNDANNQWECQCKFWWIGTYCNQQSSSGTQVIVLGILLVILVIVFYALSIVCAVRRKRQQPKKEKPKEIPNDRLNPQLKHIALANVKESTRFSSSLIAILMLLTAILALIIKWLLLQPIHNELVNKYKANEPLFYQRISFCSLLDLQDFNLLTFAVACFLLLIFIISSKRTSCMRQKWRGYVAPAIPLDFYIHIKRKIAVVVFAIIADELLDIVTQVVLDNSTDTEGVILVYLVRIAKVIVIGVRYYPILSAVYIDSILTLTCGTLYAWFDFSITIVYQSLCQSSYYPSQDDFDQTNGTDLVRFFNFYGTGQNLIIMEVFTNIPRYLCWSYIAIKLPMLLIQKIHKTIKHKNENRSNHLRLTREEKILLHSSVAHSVEMSYVRNLFRPPHQRSSTRFFLARLIPELIYQWRDDFRFSSRIVCVYAAVFFLLLFMTIQICIIVVPILNDLEQALQTLFDALSTLNSQQSEFPVPRLIPPYVLSVLTAFVVTIIQLLILLANIRRNLLQIFRGDDSEIPKRDKSQYLSYATGNFHFAGFFIGYLIWGYILTAVFAFILYVCVDAFITFGSVRFVEKILKKIIPVLLLIFFKQYLNKLLARYVFLQHYGDILAINNRRILMVFLYFNFFLDSFLGFISSIIRIIKSVIAGCLYMSRLDYSPLGRKLETLDSGFSAYCGFIHLEAVHRNPIMLVVASHLYSRMKVKQHLAKNSVTITKNNRQRTKDYSSRAIRKWHLAVFLSRNPTLVFLRKHVLLKNENMQSEALKTAIKRLSRTQQMSRRASLISQIEL